MGRALSSRTNRSRNLKEMVNVCVERRRWDIANVSGSHIGEIRRCLHQSQIPSVRDTDVRH